MHTLRQSQNIEGGANFSLIVSLKVEVNSLYFRHIRTKPSIVIYNLGQLAEFEMQYADKLSFASNTCGHKPCPKP